MCGFLICATEPEKRTLNMPFFVNDSWCKQVNAMDGVYAAFAWSNKAVQLKYLG